LPDLFCRSGGIGLGFMRCGKKVGNPEQYAGTGIGAPARILYRRLLRTLLGPGIPSGINGADISQTAEQWFSPGPFTMRLGTTPVALAGGTEITVTITQEKLSQS